MTYGRSIPLDMYGKSSETIVFLMVSIRICGKLWILQLLKLLKNLVFYLGIGNYFEICE